MTLTGEEIRSRLTAFAARWSVYEDSECSEAQTFLNEVDDGADETNAHLLALNREIAAGKRPYDPFRHLRELEGGSSVRG